MRHGYFSGCVEFVARAGHHDKKWYIWPSSVGYCVIALVLRISSFLSIQCVPVHGSKQEKVSSDVQNNRLLCSSIALLTIAYAF